MQRHPTLGTILLICAFAAEWSCNEANRPNKPPEPTAEELADFRPEDAVRGSPDAQARHWIQLLESDQGSLDGYYRQRRELARLGSAAVPALCDAIARGAEAQPNLVDNCCDLLAEMRDPAAVPYLIDLLDHPDSNITMKAVAALERIHDSRAIVPLAKHATATPESSRAPFLRALGSFQEEAAARLICGELVPDRTPETRLLAVQLLGSMRSTVCVEELEHFLVESDTRLRLEAAGSLLRLGRTEPALPVFEATLKAGVPEMRARALTLLAQSRHQLAVPILTDVVNSSDPLRSIAAAALAEFGADARVTLRLLAEDTDPTVSQTARLALVKSGDGEMRSRLIRDLSDGTPEAKHHAVEILRQARVTEAVGPLILWARNTEDVAERRLIVRALVTIGDAHALPFLMDSLVGRVDETGSTIESQQAVANLGEVALPVLEKEYISRLRDPAVDERLRIIRTVGLVAREESLTVLERLFRQEFDPSLRMALRTTARSLRRYL